MRRPNQAHTLDGRTAPPFQSARRWRAASDAPRSALGAHVTTFGVLLLLTVVGGWAGTTALAQKTTQESGTATITRGTNALQAGDERDRQVLECLALHLLSDAEFGLTKASVSGGPDARGLNVVLHCRRPGCSFKGSLDDSLGGDMPLEAITVDMLSDLRQRNPKPKAGTKESDLPSFPHSFLNDRVTYKRKRVRTNENGSEWVSS